MTEKEAFFSIFEISKNAIFLNDFLALLRRINWIDDILHIWY